MKKLKITKEQYNTLIKAGLIKESSVKGGIDRVQKTFNNAFAGKDIKSVSEDSDFNIKAPNTDLPRAQQKPLGPKHNIDEAKKGGNNKISKEIKDLLKHLYGYTPEFNSDYWVGEKGKSSDEICEYLSGKGHIIKKGRNYIVPKSIGTKEEAKAAIEECMREFVGEPMEEIEEELDTHDTHSRNNPSNQEEPEPIYNKTDYDVFVYNDGIAILNEGTEFFLLDFFDNGVDYEGREMTEDDINLFLNDKESELPKILIPLNIELVDELGEIYTLNPFFMKKLEQVKTIMSGLNEGLEDFSNEYPERSPEDMESLQKKIQARRAKELASREPMGSKHPHGEWNDPKQTELDLDEMTSAAGGSSGPFTPPMGATPIKRKIETVYESTVASTGNFQYDNPGLANIGRNGEFKQPKKKTKAQAKTQWAGGAFVELDDCTKLNNNKEAQKGGCSTGAVDGVVKLKKTSGNVNAPSLSENYSVYKIHKTTLRESFNAIKEEILDEDLELRQVGNRIEVFSNNPDARKAGNETFGNKKRFSKKDDSNNFFDWDGLKKVWYTSLENKEAAVRLVDELNKSKFGAKEDYTIDKIVQELEGLQRDIATAGVDETSCATGTSCTTTKDLNARIQKFMDELITETDSEKIAAKLKQYLDFRKNFHKYSLGNTILIMIQKPNASHVASMKAWNKVGRRIKAGSTGIAIYVPIFNDTNKDRKKPEIDLTDLDALAKAAANQGPPLTYKVGYVYDVSDTHGADIPETPQWWTSDDDNEKAMKMVFFAEQAVKANGIKLTDVASQGGERGYSANGIINIPKTLKGTGKLSTLIHEFAHELLHWPSSKFYIGDEAKTDKALLELQAESISYVVLRHYEMGELSTLNHATYLAGWGKGGDSTAGEKLKKELELVTRVGQYIINAIDSAAEKSEKQ